MTSVPVPTVVPQDAWFQLTTGPVNPSQADTVANAALLSYNSVLQQTGVVGALDGAVIFLAGTTSELDGGQKWLMWKASALDLPDGVNVFNPFPSNATPGRWENANPSGFGGVVSVTSGTSVQLNPQISATVLVVVNKLVGSATTLTLPLFPLVGQPWTIKDGKGDAATNPITILPSGSSTIDGNPSLVIVTNSGHADLQWDGVNWRDVT